MSHMEKTLGFASDSLFQYLYLYTRQKTSHVALLVAKNPSKTKLDPTCIAKIDGYKLYRTFFSNDDC